MKYGTQNETQNIENHNTTQDTKDYFGKPLPSPLPWALISSSGAALSLTLAFMMVNASPRTPQAIVLQGTVLSFLMGGLACASAALALKTSQKNKKRRGLAQQGQSIPRDLLNEEEVSMVLKTLEEIIEKHLTELAPYLEEASLSQEPSLASIDQSDGTTISIREQFDELLNADKMFSIEAFSRFNQDGYFNFEQFEEELENRRSIYIELITSADVPDWSEPS